jgi:CHAD domain-containing protein
VRARKVKGLDPAAPLQLNADRIVETRLAELLVLAGPALDPTDPRAQHSLRIAAKRLRHVLELIGPCFGPEAAAARRTAEELQGILGEIHNCDVMLPSAEGIESLLALLRTRRELLFRHFRELWLAESEAGTWLALERSLQRS